MGAYWAGSHYFDILENVDTVQYIKQPTSDIKRSYSTVATVNWNNQIENMFFYDGCALVGDGNYKTTATYANGDAMAIIQNNIGLIGCHPESEKFWFDSYSWMGKHWHNEIHHKLLLDFVNELLS
jgi:hypothetical protein